MEEILKNLPMWWYLLAVVAAVLLWIGFSQKEFPAGFMGSALLLFCWLVATAPSPFLLDAELESEVLRAEARRLEALGVRKVQLFCDAETHTLVGDFLVADAIFSKGGKVQSKTPCSKEGRVFFAEKVSREFVVRSREAYKPKLIVDELDRLVRAHFGGLVFNPTLVLDLDRKSRERMDAFGITALRFLCKDDVFQYDSDVERVKGSTAVQCRAPIVGQAPQFQIFSQMSKKGRVFDESNPLFATHYALTTEDITPSLANTLLEAALADDGRRSAF